LKDIAAAMLSAHRTKALFPAATALLIAVATCIPSCAAQTAQKSSFPLDRGWEFRQRVAGESNPAPQWRPATVPGDVHLDLLANKLIAEPYYRDNEARLQWIQDADWEYRTTIDAAASLLARNHIDLVFEGLDAYAEVYLNGQKILVADNMFREWRVEVKPYLKPGANELLVAFPSPIKTAQKIALTDVWHGQTPAQDKIYLRKAAYEYGWDWGPTFVTSGIWRTARLEAWDEARMADFYPHVRDVTKSLARVDVQLDVVSAVSAKATIAISYQEGSQSAQAKQPVNLVPGINHVVLPVEIQNPHLWFPAGYGAQPIYRWTAKLAVNGKPADDAFRKTGLRSIVLRRDLDQWGRSFKLVVTASPSSLKAPM
jgi:beta-mannosidase